MLQLANSVWSGPLGGRHRSGAHRVRDAARADPSDHGHAFRRPREPPV